MRSVRLEYCLDGFTTIEEEINTFDQLTQRLEEIKREAAPLIKAIYTVDIVAPGAGRMSIALDERCILAYTSDDGEEALTSLGSEGATGETLYYFGDYSLMSNKYVIPYDAALNALGKWIQNGSLENGITWTREIY